MAYAEAAVGIASRPAATGCTVWFTGLSGTGKTTLARLVSELLARRGVSHEVLDGDVLRETLCADLGFSRDDRETNVRRIGWACELLTRHGIVACVAAISPYEQSRQQLRRRLGCFVLVHCTAPLEVLEARDVKGLYRRARAGEIPHFTGISDPYEIPPDAEVTVHSDGSETPGDSAARVIQVMERLGYLRSV